MTLFGSDIYMMKNTYLYTFVAGKCLSDLIIFFQNKMITDVYSVPIYGFFLSWFAEFNLFDSSFSSVEIFIFMKNRKYCFLIMEKFQLIRIALLKIPLNQGNGAKIDFIANDRIMQSVLSPIGMILTQNIGFLLKPLQKIFHTFQYPQP